MKVSNRPIAKRLAFKFSTLAIFTILILSINFANAQSEKLFVDEIEVSAGVTVESNLPTALGITVHGKMNGDTTKDRYTVSGKDGQVKININKELEIKTWDKYIVKQETYIKVKAATKGQEASLLKQLKLSLNEKAGSIAIIDCNLNMERFEMRNGFFKADECKIVLENGDSYQIEYIEISTKLTIPRESNLSIKGNTNSTLRLDELLGDIDLELQYTGVYGKNVRNLRGSLKSCYNVNFDKVAFADLSSINSVVNIKNVGEVNIGIQPMGKTFKLPVFHFQRDGMFHYTTNSAQTKYTFSSVGTLKVVESGNDEIFADEVGLLEVSKTRFASFRIKKLNTSAIINASNSDIAISSVDKEFTEIEINNKLSDININVVEAAEYKLTINRDKYVEADLADKLTLESEKGASKEIYNTKNNSSNKLIKINCEDCKLKIR